MGVFYVIHNSTWIGHIFEDPKTPSKKKKGPKEPRFTLQECSPNAIGIWDSTCEINGDIFNRWKLPIQPEQRPRSPGARQKSSQQQSPFFRLLAEIRRLVYLELMGDRRVHIRYFWRKPSREPHSKPRWRWWHTVCDHSDGFIDDPVEDICSISGREGYMHILRPKIGSVEWLRCCQIGQVGILPLSDHWLIIVQIWRSIGRSLWGECLCDGRGYGHPFSDITDFGTALCVSYYIYGHLVCCRLLGPGASWGGLDGNLLRVLWVSWEELPWRAPATCATSNAALWGSRAFIYLLLRLRRRGKMEMKRGDRWIYGKKLVYKPAVWLR